MRRLSGRLALLGLAAAACVLCGREARTQQAAPPEIPPRQGTRETIQLFNGKDLSNWNGHVKYWTVQDGVIVGKNTQPVPVST